MIDREKFEDVVRKAAVQACDTAQEKGFWDEQTDTRTQQYAVKMALIHSEVSKALAELRKGNVTETVEELADTVIRIFDLVWHMAPVSNFGKVILDKMETNKTRPRMHGKKF